MAMSMLPLLLGGVGLVSIIALTGRKVQAAPAPTVAPKLKAKPTKGVPLPAELQLAVSSMVYKLVDEKGNVRPGLNEQVIQQATALAGELEARGYKEAAAYMRGLAKKAGATVPPRTTVKAPALSPDLQAMVNRVLQVERDPAKIRSVAMLLRQLPNANDPEIRNLIQMLEALAVQQEAQQSQNKTLGEIDKILKMPDDFTIPRPRPRPTAAPAPRPTPTPTPTQLPPPAVQLPKPKSALEMAAEAMVANLRRVQQRASSVRASKGKEDKGLVRRFQNLDGQKADGKAGPGTLIAAAKAGQSRLSYVMYWPKRAKASTVETYRSKLYELADQAQAAGQATRASDLRASASKERGQAGIVGPMPA